MSSDCDALITMPCLHHAATAFRCPPRRKISFRQRKKLPTIRLGGKKPIHGGFLVVRLFRRVRMRWLKLKHSRMLKKLKEYYRSVVKDIVVGSGTMESFQQRLLLETSFAIPVMGLSFNSYPTNF